MLSYNKDEIGKVQIGELTLSFLKKDGGGTHYYGRVHFEEYLSPIYSLLQKELSPSVCIDIGANYGYTGLLMRRAFPAAHLTLVEPIPWLSDFIAYNFQSNRTSFDRFYSAIVSINDGGSKSSFGVNERSSQDSRVIAQAGWPKIETAVITLDCITANIKDNQNVYIKIDTQGWEERVFSSGESFLTRHNGWFIKTEFAPMWLESQGTSPIILLSKLMERYAVFEYTGRLAWNCGSLPDALGQPLKPGCEKEFVEYVRNLGRNDTGWVDLFVLPPDERRAFALSYYL